MFKLLKWDTETEETFWFLGHAWNVRQAKRILTKYPRTFDTIEVLDFVPLFHRIVIEEEDKEINLDVPVILITTRQGNFLPIDGWHRIRKAISEGIAELPAVLLTKSESKKCEI